MNLIKELEKKKILKSGDFLLRNGTASTYYCDIKEAFGDPKLIRIMTSELIQIVPKNATCIAGSGYGGIPLATLVAYRLKLPLVLVRDTIKTHGTRKSIDGYTPTSKDRVCIVDDVFTSGSSIKETKEKLIVTRAKFTIPVVVLNRSKKSEVISLIKNCDIL